LGEERMGWVRGERRGWSVDAWGGVEDRHEWRTVALIG